jgi:hypothetical protein
MELFNNFEPSGIEDLDEDDRASALDYGCEPGKKYVGDPDGCFEVPQCPFCGVVYNRNHTPCEHLVFDYDDTNSEYIELNKQLELYYLVRYKELEHQANSDDIESASERNFQPKPWDFEEAFPEIHPWNDFDQSGCMGTCCGYAPDELLEKLKTFDQGAASNP